MVLASRALKKEIKLFVCGTTGKDFRSRPNVLF